MNWSRTKTIFIICFLLLDLFLGNQLYDRHKNSQDFDVFPQNNVESNLGKNINIDTVLPEAKKNITVIKGQRMSFVNDTGELLDSLKRLEGPKGHVIQTIEAFDNGTVIQSTLKKPIPIPKKAANQQAALRNYVYKGNEYKYWKTDEKEHTITFVQTFNDSPVFIKERGNSNTLKVFVDNGKITGYRQSYFTFSKAKNALDLISAEKAINNLWEKNELPVSLNPVVKDVELSYLNLIGDATLDKALFFMPSWHVRVKTNEGMKEFFVNATSGLIQTMDDAE
ncbi:regulatory protein YycI of two-component signal transduction system YycFG [Scopulibacillus darangshiensis]|uniref:Regulatory protein YycI of two-component signal transduction system YycFG n=1 Tax=Scopulibacillus darangshiensis TaxID=442528 RepID=A0A4R2NQ05_9BACL|nr:two-component system regulatory protein YycI [Scopulibacillus darangshiensis]TCP23434.1 regulatory protein YycI of two-component signal transduction system YycFG [Scopulibacillus darangshiensis]